MTPSRRFLVIAAAATAALALAGCSKGKISSAATADDMSLGPKDAKITVVEYASVGCPVCAKWQKDVYPAFKAKYIDTGKVHYIFREMLVGSGAEVLVAQSGFMIARCAGPDKYFPVIDAIFVNQEQAFAAPRETLQNVARSVGMTDAQFNQCIQDEKSIQALDDRVTRHSVKDGVNSTPTFVINGKQMEPGYHTLEELDAAIAGAAK
jgi:protein-disulfide isomerase